jgi:hypothetical protein
MSEAELTLQSFAMLVAGALAPYRLTAKVSVLEGHPPTVHVWRNIPGAPPDIHAIVVTALNQTEVRRVVSAAVNRFSGRNGDPL